MLILERGARAAMKIISFAAGIVEGGKEGHSELLSMRLLIF